MLRRGPYFEARPERFLRKGGSVIDNPVFERGMAGVESATVNKQSNMKAESSIFKQGL